MELVTRSSHIELLELAESNNTNTAIITREELHVVLVLMPNIQ